jgi:hypothetical protein
MVVSREGEAERGVPSSGRAPTSQVVAVAHRGEMAPMVYERMSKALGPKRAAEVMREALAQLDDRRLEGPEDVLAFAERLIATTGLVQVVGRSLKVQALLRGAVER